MRERERAKESKISASFFDRVKLKCVRTIKCLEPHAIYHEDDTCVQNEMKSVALNARTSPSTPTTQLLTGIASHHQHVDYHLHPEFSGFFSIISFPFFCLISFSVVNINISTPQIFVFRKHLTVWCSVGASNIWIALKIIRRYNGGLAQLCHTIPYLFWIWRFPCSFPFGVFADAIVFADKKKTKRKG